MKNVTFEEQPGERFCPPDRIYYIESHLFMLGKSFWSFCFLQFPPFDSAEQIVCLRFAIFHAIVQCVSRRCCLRCCSESRLGFCWWWWGKENGGGKSEWNRGGLSDTDSPGEGQFGRDWQVGIATPCTHIDAQFEIKLFSLLAYRKYMWAALQVILSRLCCLLACSSLFGFQKLHEDGARTKALLMKVANLTGCIVQPSSTLAIGSYTSPSTIMQSCEFALKLASQPQWKWPSRKGDQGQLAAALLASQLAC